MDRAEYRIATEHIKKLIAQGEYAEASHIADTIDWSRVKSVMMLCTISDLYKINRRYQDAKEILYMAYERNPESRTILYSLCDLAIKMEEFVAAIEYYKSFVEVAPRDTGRYVLQYRLYQAQDVSLEERIEVLEQLKEEEYTEKWAYELAYLYHRIGFATKCVEECDELILWFGSGRYVYKAMELKMLHEPLTPSQQHAYDKRFEHLEQAKDMTRVLPRIDSGDSEMTDESMVDVTDAPTVELPQEYIEKELQQEQPEIQVKTLDVANAYNTINLQKELADSLREILDAAQPEVPAVKVPQENISTAEIPEVVVETVTPKAEGDIAEEMEAALEAVSDSYAEDAFAETGEIGVREANGSEYEADNVSEETTVESEETAAESEEAATEAVVEAEIAYAAEEGDGVYEEAGDSASEETTVESEEAATEAVVEAEIAYAAEEGDGGEYGEAGDGASEETTVESEETAAEYEKTEAQGTEVKASAADKWFRKYADFIRVKDTKKQILQAMGGASMEPAQNHVAVTGHDLSICFEFIKLFVSDLRKQGLDIKGKTAKISAVNLNKKEPAEIMKKVQGGILIIERAGRLRKETVEKIDLCLKEQLSSILVFATDTDQGMNRFAERYPALAARFGQRVDIKDYSGEELVAYAVKYAYDCEFSIDEMGHLALRTRIDEMIANDDAPTMGDVQLIVDEAIDHACQKSFKHFMDVLLRRRYDEEDMIILKEEDFLS